MPLPETSQQNFRLQYGPDDVYGGTQYLFDTSKSGGYMKLFGGDGDLLPALSNNLFAQYAGAWFACEYIREVWKREPEPEALERRWMAFFAVGEAIRIVYRRVVKPRKRRLKNCMIPDGSPKARRRLGKPSSAFIARLLSRRCATFTARKRDKGRRVSPSKLVSFRENAHSCRRTNR